MYNVMTLKMSEKVRIPNDLTTFEQIEYLDKRSL